MRYGTRLVATLDVVGTAAAGRAARTPCKGSVPSPTASAPFNREVLRGLAARPAAGADRTAAIWALADPLPIFTCRMPGSPTLVKAPAGA